MYYLAEFTIRQGGDFFQSLEEMLERFPNDLETVALGDINIDLLSNGD